ncbi:MAG: flagellar hook protein FlgE [Clostridia bacterium]|nr:flagellar hook protein FlgE [Clostridia bacterium]
MMRSMYSGVSSLRAHQVRMDVIGNNIANVNTVGYKGSKVTFAEIYSQTVKGAGGSSTSRGGTNPQQVGLGIKIDSINVSHTKGATQRTDNATDIMIDGNGFFIVSPTADGQNKFYTRAGNFSVDELGYLVTSDGYFVIGEDGKAVQIDSTTTKGAEATDEISIGGNLDYDAEIDEDNDYIAYSVNLDVYNSVGGTQTVQIDFGQKLTTVSGAADGYSYRAVKIDDIGTLNPLYFPNGATGATATTAAAFTTAGDASTYVANAPMFAKFDEEGNFVGFVDTLVIDENGQVTGDNTIFEEGAGSLNYVIQEGGVDDITLPFDYESLKNLKHYAQETDITPKAVTGRAAGNLDSYTIAANGQVNMTYTNGESDSDQQIALASFDNPTGLLKVGTNRFIESPNSGAAKIGVPNAGSFGALTPGALEMSNVDLSAEFTDMITTQRGFQANSRVITTSDEILQELVNLKR